MELVRVTWNDAIEKLGGWYSEEEAIEWAEEDGWVVTQVGWLLKDVQEYILLCGKKSNEGSFGQLMKIPKSCIIDIYYLK